jgi:hypothetical protein
MPTDLKGMGVGKGYANENKKIVEWVIILTICLFVFFPYEMIYTSETSLGKLFFAVVVVYATTVDIAYGIAACCAVILFYQMDLYRSFVSLHRDTLLKEHMTEMQESIEEPDEKEEESEQMTESFSRGESTVYSYTPESTSSWHENSIMGAEKNHELKEIFRKTNCDANGRLTHKGVPIRPEMADHIFREIEYPDGKVAKCNPCNRDCSFSIVDGRIVQEEDLRPRESNGVENGDWVGYYITHPIHSIWEDAVFFKNRVAEYL